MPIWRAISWIEMFSSWPSSFLVDGVNWGSLSRPEMTIPSGSLVPARVPCFLYSDHPEPAR